MGPQPKKAATQRERGNQVQLESFADAPDPDSRARVFVVL